MSQCMYIYIYTHTHTYIYILLLLWCTYDCFLLCSYCECYWIFSRYVHRNGTVGSWNMGPCYRLNVYAASKFICWNLTPFTRVSVGGAFGRWLRHEGISVMSGTGALINRDLRKPSHPFRHRRVQEKIIIYRFVSGLHQTPNPPAPWSWLPSFWNCEK